RRGWPSARQEQEEDRFKREAVPSCPTYLTAICEGLIVRPHHRRADHSCASFRIFASARRHTLRRWPDGCVHSTSQFGLPPSSQGAWRLCVLSVESGRLPPRFC